MTLAPELWSGRPARSVARAQHAWLQGVAQPVGRKPAAPSPTGSVRALSVVCSVARVLHVFAVTRRAFGSLVELRAHTNGVAWAVLFLP